MAIKRFTSFGSYDWTSAGYHAGLSMDDLHGTWGVQVDETLRPGAFPSLGPGAITGRRVILNFTFPGTASVNTELLTLLGNIAAENTAPRLLKAELADGSSTPVQCTAIAVRPHERTAGEGRNGVLVEFVTADPAWRLVTPNHVDLDSVPGNQSATWSSVALNNTGKARAYPVVTYDPTGQETGSLFGRYRRTKSLTNNTGQDLNNEAFEVAIGDTTAWVGASNGADASGDNVWVYRDGIEVARELVAFNRTNSTMWVFVDHLPDGEAMTMEIIYGGPTGGPQALTGYRRPAFDHHWTVLQVAAGSTASAIEFAASSFYVDEYDNGLLYVLTGSRAGEARGISSNDTDTVNLSSALSGAPATNDWVLIRHSWQALPGDSGTANRQVYNVLLVERSELARGLWYASSGQNRPDFVRFDTPGSWEPGSFLENNDERNVPDYLYYDVGGSDFDTFTVPDIGRAGQGVYRFPTAGGVYDAVFYHDVFAITNWTFDGSFMNPNGMCKMYAGARANETRDWSDVREVTTSTVWGSGHSTFSNVSNNLTTLGEMHHLVFALVPIDEEGIGPDWQKITGSRTSGGASGTATVTDSTKINSYQDDQFNGWTFLVYQGTGAGQRRTVNDFVNSTGVFTLSSNLTVSLDDTSRYEVVAPARIRANLRTNHDFRIQRDMSTISVGATSAQANNYPVEAILRIDGGASGTTYPYYRLRIGDEDRRLFLTAATELVKIDCLNRRAWVEDGSGNELKDVTSFVVPELVRSATDIILAEEWLPLTVANHTFYIRNEGLTTANIDLDTQFGYLG